MLVFLNLLLTFLDHVRDDETVPSLTPTLSGSVPAPVPSGASAVAAAAAASLSDTSSKSVKENKEKVLTELEEAMKKLTVVNADLGEFFTIQQTEVTFPGFEREVVGTCWC